MILTIWRLGDESRLAVYTVHEEPAPVADRIDRAERLVFLRDGFSWPAALTTPLWLAARRLWLPLAVYAAIVGAVVLGHEILELSTGVAVLAVLLVHLLFGYESYEIERWGYESRGFTLAGMVTGRSKTECERRFFEKWLPAQPVIAPSAKAAPGAPQPGTLAASAGDVGPKSAAEGRDATAVRHATRWRFFRRARA